MHAAINMRNPIGLFADSRWITAVQLRPGVGRPKIRAATRFSRRTGGESIDAAEAARTLDVLHRQGFTGNRFVLAAPESDLMTMTLDLPRAADDGAADTIVRTESARALGRQPAAIEAGYLRLAAGSRRKSVPAVATALRHEDALAALDPLDEAGADVDAIEPAGFALLRACAAAMTDAAQIVAVADLGWDRLSLLVTLGGTPAYTRQPRDMSVAGLVESAANLIGVEPVVAERVLLRARPGDDPESGPIDRDAQRLTREFAGRIAADIDGSFGYVFHEHPKASGARTLLTGPGASLPGIERILEETLQTPVSVLTPADVADADKAVAETALDPALMTALGLAEHGREDGA